jgi:hypothetical protein
MMKHGIKHVILSLLITASALYCAAQEVPREIPKLQHLRATYDSSYYHSFIQDIVARFYFSQKFTGPTLKGIGSSDKLRYLPNTTLNMGVGATYKPITINLGYGFNFLNQDKEKGKTKYLDLQSHLYVRKWAFDFLGQFYTGYYLLQKDNKQLEPGAYYIRPDMHVTVIGLAAHRVLNYKKFSYRAAMVQNEYQQKSAGSFLVGVEAYYGSHTADSAFVPIMLAGKFNQQGVTQIRFLEFGPSLGYAYTLVVAKHFFATASLTFTPKFSFATEHALYTDDADLHVSIVPGFFVRGAAGYNSDFWNVNLSFVGNRLITKGTSSSDHYVYNTGNLRLTFAHRLIPGPKLRKKLNQFDHHFVKNIPIPVDAMQPQKPE